MPNRVEKGKINWNKTFYTYHFCLFAYLDSPFYFFYMLKILRKMILNTKKVICLAKVQKIS